MRRIQVIEEENAKEKVIVVYDQVRSVFGKGSAVIKAFSPWLNLLGYRHSGLE